MMGDGFFVFSGHLPGLGTVPSMGNLQTGLGKCLIIGYFQFSLSAIIAGLKKTLKIDILLKQGVCDTQHP